MGMKKVAILGIDLQNDFTSPTGKLYVKGSEKDISNISNFIVNHSNNISYIALSFDSHQPIHIATPIYWKDANGNQPDLYSVISADEVAIGKWIPQYNKDQALDYLKKLEAKGDKCTIWPPHCIIGSQGWAINQKLIDTLFDWSVKNDRYYEPFHKGFNQFTEHYSIFKAAVSYNYAPETKLNKTLISKLSLFDEVLIVGEAADFCVVNSLKDILEYADLLAQKTIIFTDCMSWIIPDNPKATAIFDKAKKAGVKFMESTEYKFDK